MKKVNVPAQPARLIKAVASIGYDPEVALCDLIDNSIDARATKIGICLEKGSQEEEGHPDTVRSYIIADNGSGMDENTLVGAFTLGTEREYPHGSLGKFGLGLKSAGLSLGSEIVILTQQNESSPLYARLSIADIEDSGKYQIDLGDIPNEIIHIWEKHAIGKHGTVLMIRELNEGQPPYSNFSKYLKRYCSIVFHQFIERDECPIEINIDESIIVPFDPLFLAKAKQHGTMGDPIRWDGKAVSLLLADGKLDLGPSVASIQATHLVHPPTFEKDAKKAREKYAINPDEYTGRARHGFYVYRNSRVIALGERFHGLVRNLTQNWAFRARLMFDESADEVLSLDVKKRHLLLPRVQRANLKSLMTPFQKKSIEAWTEAGERLKRKMGETKEDMANENIANTVVASLDYMPGVTSQNDASMTARKESQQKISKQTREAIQDSKALDKLDEEAEEGDVVVQVDGIRGNAMWMPYPAISAHRAETIINRHHSWVAEAYSASEGAPGITLVLHHLFTILARAELEVRSTQWPGITSDQVEMVFDRFRRKVSATGEDMAEHLAAALADDGMSDNGRE